MDTLPIGPAGMNPQGIQQPPQVNPAQALAQMLRKKKRKSLGKRTKK